jgi:hypothetical protein
MLVTCGNARCIAFISDASSDYKVCLADYIVQKSLFGRWLGCQYADSGKVALFSISFTGLTVHCGQCIQGQANLSHDVSLSTVSGLPKGDDPRVETLWGPEICGTGM